LLFADHFSSVRTIDGCVDCLGALVNGVLYVCMVTTRSSLGGAQSKAGHTYPGVLCAHFSSSFRRWSPGREICLVQSVPGPTSRVPHSLGTQSQVLGPVSAGFQFLKTGPTPPKFDPRIKRRSTPPNHTCPYRRELDIDNHTDPSNVQSRRTSAILTPVCHDV